MIALAAFLAGMSFVIAIAACIALRQEKERAQSCERALSSALTEQSEILLKVAKDNLELDAMIRAVAAASVAPTFPSDQSKVFISVPGPRTPQ